MVYKNLNEQTKSGGPKTVDSEAILQHIEANLTLGENQASSASHSLAGFVSFTTFAKIPRVSELFLALPKYCQTFDLPWCVGQYKIIPCYIKCNCQFCLDFRTRSGNNENECKTIRKTYFNLTGTLGIK